MLIGSASTSLFAQNLDCTHMQYPLCKSSFKPAREALAQKQLTALLVTDAPVKLILDTEQLWLNRLRQCHNSRCVQQQIDLRQDDLNIYTSLNQTLTQHYLKYQDGQPISPNVHLKLHQLDKANIKIEGIAYRNPNNRSKTQQINFLAYSTAQQKNNIHNNEQNCDYVFDFQKAILKVRSEKVGCERFNGIYRLYD